MDLPCRRRSKRVETRRRLRRMNVDCSKVGRAVGIGGPTVADKNAPIRSPAQSKASDLILWQRYDLRFTRSLRGAELRLLHPNSIGVIPQAEEGSTIALPQE